MNIYEIKLSFGIVCNGFDYWNWVGESSQKGPLKEVTFWKICAGIILYNNTCLARYVEYLWSISSMFYEQF